MGLKLGQPLKSWLHRLPPARPSKTLQNDLRLPGRHVVDVRFWGHRISELANYDAPQSYGEAPPGGRRGETSAVELFPANGWGLHDLHGNV
jgi:hypothetical protein